MRTPRDLARTANVAAFARLELGVEELQSVVARCEHSLAVLRNALA